MIADGLDPNNPDLHRATASRSSSTTGTSAASAPTPRPTAARRSSTPVRSPPRATQTYDLSGFVNPAHPLPPGCTIRIKGVAPGATIAALNLAGPNAGFFNSTDRAGHRLGREPRPRRRAQRVDRRRPEPNTLNDAVALADKAAVAAGVTVVASTGDAGPDNSIGSPASTPGVINAGGSTTYQVYRQTTRYDTQLVPGRLAEQQHLRAELGRHHRVRPAHRRRRRAGRPGLEPVQHQLHQVLRLPRTSITAPIRRPSGRRAAPARRRR